MSARDLASRLNLYKRTRSYAGDCPCCGYARAFSVRDGRDGRTLVYCANGCDQAALSDTLARMAGSDWTPPATDPRRELDQAAARARSRSRALALWEGATPVPGTLTARYLASRCIGTCAGSAALRHRDVCRHPEGGSWPAMIALVTDAAGAPMAVHRHYLDSAGGKACVDPPKATLGSPWGGAVHLDPCGPELAVGEGIETSAACGLLTGLPAWSAISAGNLAAAMALPPEVRAVVIAVNRDQPGERAARAAAARWRAESRAVRLMWPDTAGQDAADVLRAREAVHA